MRILTITLAGLAAFTPVAALAYPGQGIPNPRYPDGTGNVAVEQLNNAQLDQNYRGPFYTRGQQPPSEVAPPPPAYPPPGYAPVQRPQP